MNLWKIKIANIYFQIFINNIFLLSKWILKNKVIIQHPMSTKPEKVIQ